nr:Gfo/Idh/MocA family oxidoreductase [Microbacterium pseudoresistens]
MTVGILGAGGIAPCHLEAWRALGATCLIASRTPPMRLAADHGAEVLADADELIARADVVDILTPTPTHADYALRAIAAGRYVVCEKPLAGSAADAQRIADAAAAAGVLLFPAHVVRYFPAYTRIHRAVAAGVLGGLREVRLSRVGTAPTADWFFSERAGGGIIRDFLIHDIDQALWLAGPVRSVNAAQNPPTVGDRVPMPVRAEVVLEHESGTVSRIHGAWMPGGAPFHTTIDVIGERGEEHYDSAPDADAGTTGYLPSAEGDDPYTLQLADAVRAIRTGATPAVTAADGVAAVAVVDAAYASLNRDGGRRDRSRDALRGS